jgi:hypothetical protein
MQGGGGVQQPVGGLNLTKSCYSFSACTFADLGPAVVFPGKPLTAEEAARHYKVIL